MNKKAEQRKKRKEEIMSLPDIIIEVGKLESLWSPEFQGLLRKGFKNVRLKYWLARISDKMKQESKTYIESKQEIIDKHKETDEEKMKEKNIQKGGFLIKEDSFEDYQKELLELQGQEINLNIKQISISFDDLEPCTPLEIELLLPFVQLEEGEVIPLLAEKPKEENKPNN